MPESREELLRRLEGQARQIRRNVFRALHAAGSGHVGGSLSAADMLSALYFHTLRIRPQEPNWPDRDRFVLSKGHANAALSSALALAGYFPEEWLDRYYKLDSLLGMHPDIKLDGVEMSTGALGHGLPVAMGMALGARIQGKDFRSFVMLGDAECHEGSNWEGAMGAAHYRLSNLTVLVDFNKVGQSGHVADLVGVEPMADKWRAFGFEVREINGHVMGEIVDAFDALPFNPKKPSCIVAHTVKGKGVSFAEDTYVWHSNDVTADVRDRAIKELEAV